MHAYKTTSGLFALTVIALSSLQAQNLDTAHAVHLTPLNVVNSRSSVDRIPGGTSLIDAVEIKNTRRASLTDVVKFTPGVFAESRFGAADESQLSIRGSGLRNNYHARGLNILLDGLPYRNADGFTDYEALEMLAVDNVEVYKGANALRYGGSTLGGAINLKSKNGRDSDPLSTFVEGGAYGFAKAQIASGGASQGRSYYSSYAHTSLDNYRQWGAQRRDRVNLSGIMPLGERTQLGTTYIFAKVHEELPGALTGSEFDSNPSQANATNASGHWGRDYTLNHVGVRSRTKLTSNQSLETGIFFQYRYIDHPIFEVINQISRDLGADIRYENVAAVGGSRNRLTVGFEPSTMNMDNRQYQNLAGEHGALTRDEKDKVNAYGFYFEDGFGLSDKTTLLIGGRVDNSSRAVADHFLSNGDQSDRRSYQSVTPRIGLLRDVQQMGGEFFANVSKTVEPPLLLEMTSFGNPGGFIPLKAQQAWQAEVGARGGAIGLSWELSLYDIELNDELLNLNVPPFTGAPFTVPTFRNADRTRHSGIEAGASWRIAQSLFDKSGTGDQVTVRTSITLAQYSYLRDSSFGGKQIPGAPRQHLLAEVQYAHPSGVTITPRVESVPQSYFVNSANTVRNSAWTTLELRAEWKATRTPFTIFAEGQNLTDRKYSATVQVDVSDGRYFEPF